MINSESPDNHMEKMEIPSQKSIVSVLENLTEGKEYTEVRRLEDEKGVYLWEIKLAEVDKDGGTIEYSYSRQGQFPETKALKTAIHSVFYNVDGVPIGGNLVATYSSKGWVDCR